jgi:hypothetical protein
MQSHMCKQAAAYNPQTLQYRQICGDLKHYNTAAIKRTQAVRLHTDDAGSDVAGVMQHHSASMIHHELPVCLTRHVQPCRKHRPMHQVAMCDNALPTMYNCLQTAMHAAGGTLPGTYISTLYKTKQMYATQTSAVSPAPTPWAW